MSAAGSDGRGAPGGGGDTGGTSTGGSGGRTSGGTKRWRHQAAVERAAPVKAALRQLRAVTVVETGEQ